MTGFSMIANDPKVLIMIAISLVLMYLAIVKKFEPLLLLPIAFGMLLTNLPGAEMYHRELFAFYLFEPMGISFKQLTNRLIELAFAGAKEKKASTFAFDSKILEMASIGIKTVKK